MRILRLLLAVLAVAQASASMAASESLCSADEEVIFSCTTKRKAYEICASKNITARSGYMQYRAGAKGKADFIYPKERVAPAGKFQFNLLPRGAQLSFHNGEFTYEIVEPLIGTPQILVSRENGSPVLAAECQNHSDSLTLTSTQNRFKSLGIYE
ncbi:MAG: hypothetical protein H6944_02315 [Zoogloeaceae bacterium]|nr:hypothetical protein [Zoogloeaceae bacterium]